MKKYSIESERLRVEFTDYGGRIIGIYLKDESSDNFVLSYDTPEEYLTDDACLGAIVGRYANRIGNAAFTLGDKTYTLPANDNGKNCLHSANENYAERYFEVEDSSSVALLRLRDKSGLFPGNVDLTVKYTVLGASLIIEYNAKTDAPTVMNLTNHSYFNPQGSAEDTEVRFYADYFTPIDEYLIPTGEIKSVVGTPFDFREYRRVGDFIGADDVQLKFAGGFDHNYIKNGKGISKIADIYMPVPDLTLSVITSMPGFQFYTANFLGEPFSKRAGFCIETQNFPDSPNKKDFPSCIYTPERPFKSKTIYGFSWGKSE